jgi:hypothetical protein
LAADRNRAEERDEYLADERRGDRMWILGRATSRFPSDARSVVLILAGYKMSEQPSLLATITGATQMTYLAASLILVALAAPAAWGQR